MPEAVIVATARTAIGTAFKGTLVDVDTYELATRAVGEVVSRSGIDPALIDDVVMGESRYGGGLGAGRDGPPRGGIAVAAMCAGGGMSTAVVFDVPPPAGP